MFGCTRLRPYPHPALRATFSRREKEQPLLAAGIRRRPAPVPRGHAIPRRTHAVLALLAGLTRSRCRKAPLPPGEGLGCGYGAKATHGVWGEGAAPSAARSLVAPGFARTLIRPFGPPSPDGRRNSLFFPLVFDGDPRPFHGVMPYRDGRMQSWRDSRVRHTRAAIKPLSHRERGWGEGTARKRLKEFGARVRRQAPRGVWLHQASPVPSSGPSGHLLPAGEGTAYSCRWCSTATHARSVGSFRIATDACSTGATRGSDTLALPSSPSPIGRGVGVRVRRESDSRSLGGEGAAPSVSRCLVAPGFARTLIRPFGPPSPVGRRNSLCLSRRGMGEGPARRSVEHSRGITSVLSTVAVDRCCTSLWASGPSR